MLASISVFWVLGRKRARKTDMAVVKSQLGTIVVKLEVSLVKLEGVK